MADLMTPTITAAQYVRKARCPFCGSEDLEGDIAYEGTVVWQNMVCRSCDREHTDEYARVGFGWADQDGNYHCKRSFPQGYVVVELFQGVFESVVY